MIEIYPSIQHQSNCLHCGTLLKHVGILWQGMHICVNSKCPNCAAEFVEDIKVGHATTMPYQIDLKRGLVSGNEEAKYWLGNSLLESLQNPQNKEIKITKEVFKTYPNIILLNCIDFLYGHCLLKLLNAQRHLENNPDCGLIVIVPKLLRWMVPDGVAEVWTVDISLKKSRSYYPNLNQFIQEDLKRFNKVYVSKAYSHPSRVDIAKYTRIPQHDFGKESFKITFVWREDRTWCNSLLFRLLRKLKLLHLALLLENWKVRRLLKQIKFKIPSATLAVAGLGKKTKFPQWIEDWRVEKFDETTEREICKVYSESRLLIGVHGSNMLLPSGHAGMTIDLMPKDRWGNFAQDILYQETDPRLASFRYRYLPSQTSVAEIAYIASSMLLYWFEFSLNMTADKSR